MIHYSVTMGAYVNTEDISFPGWETTHFVRLSMAGPEERISFAEDQDWITTTQPESNPYTREHDCFHEKLRGSVNLSLASYGGSELNNFSVVAVNPEPGDVFTVTYTGEGDHPTTERGMLTISAVSSYDDGKRANIWGEYTAEVRYWNHYTQEWRERTHTSRLIATDKRMMHVSIGPNTDDVDAKVEWLRDRLNRWHLHNWQTSRKYFLENVVYYHADQQLHPGTLAAQAAASARRLDINTLAFVKDIVEIPAMGTGLVELGQDLLETADSLSKTAKRVKHARRAGLKILRDDLADLSVEASKAYLSNHYGLKLTIADTQSIAKAIEKVDLTQKYQTVGADGTVTVDLPAWGTTCEVHTKLTAKVGSYDDKQLHCCESINESTDQLTNMVKRAGYELDVLPTASNLWDLVPLSFVVDWFLPIGENLALSETKNYMATLPVKCCFITRRTEYDEDDFVTLEVASSEGVVSLVGSYTIHHSIYDRRYSDVLPIPPYGTNNTGEGGAFDHVVEASALLVSFGH